MKTLMAPIGKSIFYKVSIMSYSEYIRKSYIIFHALVIHEYIFNEVGWGRLLLIHKLTILI